MNRRLWRIILIALLNASLPVAFLAVRLTSVVHDLEAQTGPDLAELWALLEASLDEVLVWSFVACLPVAALSGWVIGHELAPSDRGSRVDSDNSASNDPAGDDPGWGRHDPAELESDDLAATRVMKLPPTIPSQHGTLPPPPPEWSGAGVAPNERR